MQKLINLKNHFLDVFRSHKKKFVLGGILVLAISVPLVVAQVLKQQDTRQRASGARPVDLINEPVQNQYTVGSDVFVGFSLSTNTNDVSAIDTYVWFDSSFLSPNGLIPGSNYTEITWPQNTDTAVTVNGIQMTRKRIVLVNKTATPQNALLQHLVRFQFKALKTGQTTVRFGSADASSNLTIAASGSTQKIASNNPAVSQTINIVNALSPTPPPYAICSISSPCPTGFVCTHIPPGADTIPQSYCLPIPTLSLTPSPQYDCNGPTGLWPNGCTCSNDQQCAGGKCAPNGTSGICTDRLTPTPANNQTDNSVSGTPTPSPTITQIPTVTLSQGETGIKLSLRLPGIGKVSGDNATPRRSVRSVKITVFDNTNAQVGVEHAGTVEYNTANGRFEGNIGLGTTFTTGSYTVKVKMDNTLIKRLSGIVTITQGNSENPTPQADLITGDLNQDNSLDVQDFTNVMACFHHESACTGDIAILGDLNDNGITDGDNDDMNILQRNFTNREGD